VRAPLVYACIEKGGGWNLVEHRYYWQTTSYGKSTVE